MAPTPKDHLISRVSTWCGIQVHDEEVPRISVRDKTIARFPTNDSMEAAACGSIQQKLSEEPEFFPDGVWENNNAHHIIIDLRLPGGIEEAVRALLNAYIESQNSHGEKWWIDNDFLKHDPHAHQVLKVIAGFREKLGFTPTNTAKTSASN